MTRHMHGLIWASPALVYMLTFVFKFTY